MTIRTAFARVGAGLTAATAILAGGVIAAPAASAASTSTNWICTINGRGDGGCSRASGYPSSALVGKRLAVTLWEGGSIGSGNYLKIYIDKAGDVCTSTTGDIDFSIWLPDEWERVASAVQDNPLAHCDWRLVGPHGGTSVWVQNSYAPLSSLGSNWSDRAVRVQLT